MRREEWKRDPAPLAYRVLPQPEEFFDSWLDRLVSRHGTARIGLFEFLGLEPGLARLDLGGGQEVTGRADAGAAIERLAWAVQCEVSVVQATLVPASGECLLPPRGRHYGCPQCWLEFHLAGKPLVIQREWTLRQSWLCRKHQALLVDLRDVPRRADGVIDLASLRRLAAVAVRALELLGFAEPRLLANRHAALKLLGQGAAERPPPGLDAYMREFSANRLHVVPARTLLLAHAHCHDRKLPRRFAATFAVPVCPGAELPRMPLPKSAMSRAMLAVALRRVHRHRLRRRYRRLEAAAQRLSAFSYLAGVGCDGPDWCQRALHALGAESRQRRSRAEALASLRLARDFAIQAELRRRPRWDSEPFDPACWGFALPTARALELAVARLEAKGERSPAVPNHQISP